MFLLGLQRENLLIGTNSYCTKTKANHIFCINFVNGLRHSPYCSIISKKSHRFNCIR